MYTQLQVRSFTFICNINGARNHGDPLSLSLVMFALSCQYNLKKTSHTRLLDYLYLTDKLLH